MDPWHTLGLDPSTATTDAVLGARRSLAKSLHPDVGGRGHDLADVNRAVELCLADLASREAAAERVPMPAPGPEAAIWLEGEDAADAVFSVPHLPAEAFELLLLAFSSIGDPKVVEEPYLLEGMVDDPFLGHAVVELVPEAGGSMVMVSTAPFRRAGTPPPTPAQIAGRLLHELRALEL